ncbi:hypothetical protein CXU21_09135 [Akkermansia muciniphila]|jgi:hypothetical protein|nr:hypothetical protein CXU21_09135 [Akkermansia muciniphila]
MNTPYLRHKDKKMFMFSLTSGIKKRNLASAFRQATREDAIYPLEPQVWADLQLSKSSERRKKSMLL